jgi:hypothetical protein
VDRPTREGPNEKESATATQCGKAMHQMSAQAELLLNGLGEAPTANQSGEAGRAGVEMYAQETATVTPLDDLNFSNRRMRTRMSGGVGGEQRDHRCPLSRLQGRKRRCIGRRVKWSFTASTFHITKIVTRQLPLARFHGLTYRGALATICSLQNKWSERSMHPTSETAPRPRGRFAKPWVSRRSPGYRRSSVGG